jgi:hypothetical protein
MVAKILKENEHTTIADMKWSFQKKVVLPLKDIMGFQTMIQQGQGLKDANSTLIIVELPASAIDTSIKLMKLSKTTRRL